MTEVNVCEAEEREKSGEARKILFTRKTSRIDILSRWANFHMQSIIFNDTEMGKQSKKLQNTET